MHKHNVTASKTRTIAPGRANGKPLSPTHQPPKTNATTANVERISPIPAPDYQALVTGILCLSAYWAIATFILAAGIKMAFAALEPIEAPSHKPDREPTYLHTHPANHIG